MANKPDWVLKIEKDISDKTKEKFPPDEIQGLFNFWEIHNGLVSQMKPERKNSQEVTQVGYYLYCGWEKTNSTPKRDTRTGLHHVHIIYNVSQNKWTYNIKDYEDEKLDIGRIEARNRKNILIDYKKQKYSPLGCVNEIWKKLECRTDESAYINNKILWLVMDWCKNKRSAILEAENKTEQLTEYGNIGDRTYQYVLYCEPIILENRRNYKGKSFILSGGRKEGWTIYFSGSDYYKINLRQDQDELLKAIEDRCSN